MFWKRTKIWLQYAKRNRWQAVGFLLFGIIPLAIFHLLQRQIEVWEDGTVGVASSGYTLVFPPKLTQFGERDHKCFMEAWLEHPTLPGRDGGQLSNVMRTANVDSLNFVIRYKDLDSVWYKSNCRIELDVSLQSGLRAIFLGQALLGDNPEELQESPPSAEMIHAVHVELTPSQGQADRMYLEVENFGEKQTFHAQCRVLARRNDPNPQRLLTLDLGWVRNKARELEIRRGETCSLYVARAGQGRPSRDIEWIEIVGSPERVQSQWAIGQVTPLPEYDVEIVIFGGENQQPYSEKFTIRAGRNAHWRCLSSKPTRRYGRMLVQAGHSCI